MKVFKKLMSKILVVTVALGSVTLPPVHAEERNHCLRNRMITNAALATGAAAVVIVSVMLYNKCSSNPDSNSDKELDFRHQMEFIQNLNSFPTEKPNANEKYVKLSPALFSMTLSCRKKMPQNYFRNFKIDDIYINLEDAHRLAENLHTKLCTMYMKLHNIETEQLINYHVFTLADFYDDIAIKETWKTDPVAEMYMEYCNFYCMLRKGIVDLELPGSNVGEITLCHKFMEKRDAPYGLFI